MKLRVAVIGLGHIGILHSRIYKQNPSVELVGVCDRVPERAEAGAQLYGVPSFLNAEQMLSELKPDLVSVATGGFEYSSDHYEPTMQALQHGCHVLCEKPISNELNTAREMVAEAKRLGRCFALDFNHRFTPAALAAHKWLEQGLLGELLFCNMALWIGRFEQLETENYHLKALNPHSVNIMEWFCGPIQTVQCFAKKSAGRNIWSTASWNMRFANGVVGHLTSSYDIARGHPMERCEVAGIGARVVIEDMWREATLYPAGNEEKRVVANPVFGGYRDFDDTFQARINSYVAQIVQDVSPEDVDGSGADGLRAQTVIHAGIRSLNEGNRPVDVSEL
ncbi:MAG: Gfo/Idh/MocA family protein [Armatimonadota bacterium]